MPKQANHGMDVKNASTWRISSYSDCWQPQTATKGIHPSATTRLYISFLWCPMSDTTKILFLHVLNPSWLQSLFNTPHPFMLTSHVMTPARNMFINLFFLRDYEQWYHKDISSGTGSSNNFCNAWLPLLYHHLWYHLYVLNICYNYQLHNIDYKLIKHLLNR